MPAAPSQDLFHPAAVLASYRRLNPGKFDEFTDSQLLDAIKRVDPDTYKLVDPQLIGEELLGDTRKGPEAAPPPAQTKIPTPPAQPDWLDTGVTTALRVGGQIGGGMLGAAGGPVGLAAGGAAGAAAGDQAAQWYERQHYLRGENSLTESVVQGILGAVPLGEVGEMGLVGRTAVRAAQGGLLGRAGGLAEGLVTGNYGNPLEQYGAGAATGAAFHGATEAVDAAGQSVSGLADVTGRLPEGGTGARPYAVSGPPRPGEAPLPDAYFAETGPTGGTIPGRGWNPSSRGRWRLRGHRQWIR